MHSWPMMVESMSATNSRFQRGSSGWTTTSTPSSAVERPARGLGIAGEAQVGGVALVDPVEERAPSDRARAAARARGRPACHRAVPLLSASQWPWPRPNPPLVLIAGPTASGKSALALALAEQIGGVIVNADSAQIYRDLPILSAAPTADERERAEHRLYGVRDGALPCSAADWAAMARARDRRHPRERADCRSWSAGPAFICAPCSTGSRRCRRSIRRFARAVRDAPVEDNRAKLRAARSRSGGAAQPGRHRAHRARARSRSCRPAGRSPNGRSSAKAGSRTRSSFAR